MAPLNANIPLQPNKLPNTQITWPHLLVHPSDLQTLVRSKAKLSKRLRELNLIKVPSYSKIILQIIGTWAYSVANVFNKSHVYNGDAFYEQLKQTELTIESQLLRKESDSNCRPHQASPLITFSNHISCVDDPIVWGSLLPFNYYSTKNHSIRWSLAASEICFKKPWHSIICSLGKAFPVTRGAGLNQPAVDFSRALLELNQWVHFFPEGRVMRDKLRQPLDNVKDYGYKFKWGISKIIMDHILKDSSEKRTVRVLPFYHLGLDVILPIGWPYIPRVGKKITIYFRPQVIEFDRSFLNEIFNSRTISEQQSRYKSPDEIKRVKLTNYLEDEMERLIAPAINSHNS